MFSGIRVVEIASFQLVPMAAAVLAEFGADVVKVEPLAGDPQRTLLGAAGGGTPPSVEQTNRGGKRSVALDTGTDSGRAQLRALCLGADVVMTNLREPACARLGIREPDLRAARPDLVYVRGTALGSEGPDTGRPGFDITAYWARGGISHALGEPDHAAPVAQRPGFGDKQGAMNLAFGVAAALLRREREGVGPLVETSLLAGALWSLSSDVVASGVAGRDVTGDPVGFPGPLDRSLRTSDGRWLRLQLMDGQRHWPDLCVRLGRPELAADPAFDTVEARRSNAAACADVLEQAVAGGTLEEWRDRFAGAGFAWEVHQDLVEVLADAQVIANDYVPVVDRAVGGPIRLVRAPVRFDGQAPPLRAAPLLGEHSDEVLAALDQPVPGRVSALGRSVHP